MDDSEYGILMILMNWMAHEMNGWMGKLRSCKRGKVMEERERVEEERAKACGVGKWRAKEKAPVREKEAHGETEDLTRTA